MPRSISVYGENICRYSYNARDRFHSCTSSFALLIRYKSRLFSRWKRWDAWQPWQVSRKCGIAPSFRRQMWSLEKFQRFLLNVQLMWRWCLPVDRRLRKYLCRMFRVGVLNIMMLKPLSHRGLAELENSRTDSPGSLLPVASNCARRGRLNTHCYPLLSEMTF